MSRCLQRVTLRRFVCRGGVDAFCRCSWIIVFVYPARGCISWAFHTKPSPRPRKTFAAVEVAAPPHAGLQKGHAQSERLWNPKSLPGLFLKGSLTRYRIPPNPLHVTAPHQTCQSAFRHVFLYIRPRSTMCPDYRLLVEGSSSPPSKRDSLTEPDLLPFLTLH